LAAKINQQNNIRGIHFYVLFAPSARIVPQCMLSVGTQLRRLALV